MTLRYPHLKSEFKDSMNRYKTQSLFREFYIQDIKPVYCLLEEDSKGELPSLKKLYMDVGDPTEYEFAMQAFGSWKHWLKIKSAKAIQPWIEDWPTELEVKLRSEGIRKVIQESSSGKSTFNAAKYLANGEWNRASKRGRPTKEEVERERKIAAKLDAEFSEDAQRIGLRVIKGGENGG